MCKIQCPRIIIHNGLKKLIIKNLSFSRSQKEDFAATVKKRVAEYFKSNSISKYGSNQMVFKSITMLLLFLTPLALIILAPISSPWIIFLLYIIAGIGMGGIGMGIMHDAIHGSYSKKKWFNTLMANTIIFTGASKEMWRLQHNVLHHSYTNIEDHDEDIAAPPLFLRFSPNAPKNKLHRYQHLYAWFFYGLLTISWITTKDFMSLNRYYKMGLIQGKKNYRSYLLKIILLKLNFFTLVLVLPLIFSAAPTWAIVCAFLTMQFVTGFAISIVFQSAHVMPDVEFPTPNAEGKIDNERMVHQLLTTANFAQKSKLLYWYLGGLTNQIEHHLFPNISHIHYKKIAPIVKKTAEEFGLPYVSNGSFFNAVGKHFGMLKKLGRMEVKSA
ncbi:MAG: acyl-CoA desaturase [Crocinitomicaceae bacterium]|nr:acyl-CoA desaturase [Crocinitomicaceae bacterium]